MISHAFDLYAFGPYPHPVSENSGLNDGSTRLNEANSASRPQLKMHPGL